MSKEYEIAYLADKHQLYVIWLQEHRISQSEILLQENLFRHILVTSSCTKNLINTIGGVGFLLSQKILECSTSRERINDCIITIDLEDNLCTPINYYYSPTNVSPDQKMQSFYDTLISTVSNTPAHNMLFIAGDFNAKIGSMEQRTTTNRLHRLIPSYSNQRTF